MKPIIVTNNLIEKLCEQLRTKMVGAPATGANISVSIPTKINITKEEMPTVMVSDIADRKMRALVQQCTEEIAWHGTVDFDAESNTYTIDDIFVFPQEITPTTAVSKDVDYEQWLMALPDDVFNRLRFHGHSHVNMGVFPSAVDTSYQDTMLSQIEDFYIFAILNKKDDYNIWVYNKPLNIMYEKDDINYDAEVAELAAWVHTEMTAKVSKRTYVQTTPTKPSNFGVTEPAGWRSTWADGYHWDKASDGYIPNAPDEKKITGITLPKTKGKPGRPPKNKPAIPAAQQRLREIECNGDCKRCSYDWCPYMVGR